MVKSIGLFDNIFLNLVPDQNKLAFTQQYFKSHLILMSCFLSMERIVSALLVIDLGRAKELHCCIEKQRNCGRKEIFGYARAIWRQIEAGEEQIRMVEFQQIVQQRKEDSSVLVYAFDLKGFLNVWVLHDRVIFRRLDARLETILMLIIQLFGGVNVIVDDNSSFYKASSVSNSQINFPFEMESRKPVDITKNAGENSVGNYSNLSDREILEILFQVLVASVKDLCKGDKLIVVPDPLLFFTPFSALIDESGFFLSDNYSIQIAPSMHTLKYSIEQSRDSNFGFALFVGNPSVGNVSLNGLHFKPSDLPYAAEEVKCLSKLFQATPLLGCQARKQVVWELLSGASIIHIAAHGEPNRGEIMLAPNSSP
jgi:CHAT domain-containing protein